MRPDRRPPEAHDTPSRRRLHTTFWVGHLLVVAGVVYILHGRNDTEALFGVTVFLIGALVLLTFCIFVARYASRFGRSALIWCGLMLVTLPVGLWVAYVSALRLGSRAQQFE